MSQCAAHFILITVPDTDRALMHNPSAEKNRGNKLFCMSSPVWIQPNVQVWSPVSFRVHHVPTASTFTHHTCIQGPWEFICACVKGMLFHLEHPNLIYPNLTITLSIKSTYTYIWTLTRCLTCTVVIHINTDSNTPWNILKTHRSNNNMAWLKPGLYDSDANDLLLLAYMNALINQNTHRNTHLKLWSRCSWHTVKTLWLVRIHIQHTTTLCMND